MKTGGRQGKNFRQENLKDTEFTEIQNPHPGFSLRDLQGLRANLLYLLRRRETSGRVRSEGSSACASAVFCNASQLRARSREKLPDLSRLSCTRCAPQPRSCPMS